MKRSEWNDIFDPQLIACQNGPTQRADWQRCKKVMDRVRARRSLWGLAPKRAKDFGGVSRLFWWL